MKRNLILSLIIILLIISCKKINLLGPNDIPPPTEFPNTEYPTPTPVPVPPIDIEEKPIIVKPEIVSGKTVFGGYAKRFKYKNEWYVLATNEYDTDTKSLEKTGKAALLKIANDGSTITKIGGYLLLWILKMLIIGLI